MLAGPAQGAVALQPGRQPQARQAAPAVRAAAHARARLHHRRAVAAGADKQPLVVQARHRRSSPCTPSTSPRWCGRRSTSATRTTPTPRLPRLHHAREARTRRRPTSGAARRARVRPPPRLPRPRGLRRPAARARPRRRSRKRCRSSPTATTCSPPSCSRRARSRSRPTARGGEIVEIAGDGLQVRGARRSARRRAPNQRIRRGAVIRVQKDEKGGWQITAAARGRGGARRRSIPQTARSARWSAASTSTATSTTTSPRRWRQPGSSFKPFIYSAALEKGFTPATVINDAPLVIDAAQTGGQPWEPKNYDGKFEGPMRLRTALAKSKNMVSVRILQAIGTAVRAGLHHALRLRSRAAPALSHHGARRGLGDAAADGARLRACSPTAATASTPYFIERIEDDRGNAARAGAAGDGGRRDAERVDRRAQRLHHGQHDAGRRAHGHRARARCRSGARISPARPAPPTTSSTPGSRLPAGAGRRRLDRVRPAAERSARNETGGAAALPIWMGYMRTALKGVPEMQPAPPPGVVSVRDRPGDRHAVARRLHRRVLLPRVPAAERRDRDGRTRGTSRTVEEVRNQLF